MQPDLCALDLSWPPCTAKQLWLLRLLLLLLLPHQLLSPWHLLLRGLQLLLPLASV
jgi:hypothetical protein